jgi:class 3 adenylate cyclase
VAADPNSAEYKQVTVLFADVVHSMDMAASLGAERLREIMTGLVDRASVAVQRFGGTVDKFTGDGIMAVFGAPVALEDHAIRACLAALSIQEQTAGLASEVKIRDGIDLHLRVGLNSGQVIVGQIGSNPLGYTAIGEQVGMAQRMESAAPPGGVMLSASTARLVEMVASLGDPELVHIKGADRPVRTQQLLGVPERDRGIGAASTLVGRRWEMAAVEALMERAIEGHGAVITMVGSPGIGKSRMLREVASSATARGVEVFTGYCQSHTSDIPFYAVARLLRAATGVRGLENADARRRLRVQAPDGDPEDLLLFEDLLGITDPEVALPKIDPDARRRRLTALVDTALVARTTAAVYLVEDVHWIDEVSEAMLADFMTVIPQTSALVLITYRPEYSGALSRVPGAQSINLAPLSHSETAALITGLLGRNPSVGELGHMIAERAAGNPFFTEEIVRDLAERGVVRGTRGDYISTVDAAEVSVPGTVHAAIAARIDRLGPGAKRTLSAAAVIGSKFSRDVLETLRLCPVLDDLVNAELIDQVTFTTDPAYVFHHPLIRAVAYESQLKSDRAELHRRVATAIEDRNPESSDENAALIAEHLESAGDHHAAYSWHMRAATWATNRDIGAARLSWQRAQRIADALPADDPERIVMRIAPRTMLCGIAWRVHGDVVGSRFDELRQLCAAAGDNTSLAIGMAGLMMDHAFRGQVSEASKLASEGMALIESIGDPTLTVGLSFAPIYVKMETAEHGAALAWSQRVIDLADGDPFQGSFIFGAPLAAAHATRAIARYCLGRPGWRDDLTQSVAIARAADPASYGVVVTYAFSGTSLGVVAPDEQAVREIEGALLIAERSGDDLASSNARMTLGMALVHRPTQADRDRGNQLLAEAREAFLRRASNLSDIQILNVYLAREQAQRGDPDAAVPLMRAAVDHLAREDQLLGWGVPATGVLVETLLRRGAEADFAEAEAAIERISIEAIDGDAAVRDVWLLRLRTLLAQAHGDDAAYRHFRDRYRNTAQTLGFEGHIGWAEAM